MADVDLKGKWVASNIMEQTIQELRSAGYFPAEDACRTPGPSPRIPTPLPGERVVFLSHLIQRLGFPLHPSVRGIIFFYGLDFHHLTLNSILHLVVFITVCEAFLRVKPHFGLWLKTFNIKPKSSDAQLAECGGP